MKRYEYISIEVPGRLRELAERLKMQQLGDSGWLVLSTSTRQIDRRFDEGGSTEALLMREIEETNAAPVDEDPDQHHRGRQLQCEPWAEAALDQIDAGMFSGDTFEDPEPAARLRYFMARWTRELDRRQTARG